MFKDLTVFQIVVIVVFLIFAAVGLFVLATGDGGGSDGELGPVTIWGTEDEDVMADLLSLLNSTDDRFGQVTYEEKDSRTFDDEFVNALAIGGGPDLILLPHSAIVSTLDKLTVIPYASFSERQFKDTFIEQGELFLNEEGILGFPFSVDPLVLYWNRDIFQAEGVASPPLFWDELFVLAPRITKRDQSSNIVQSFAALGEFRNVVHAKEILTSLILQTGNPLVVDTDTGLQAVLDETFEFTEPPTVSALRFFTEFSNPIKSVYSWNRALPDSRQSFIAGDLALYIGFASEFSELKRLNPNLNFDVVELPQSRETERKVTFGNVEALAISRGSTDIASALMVAAALTGARSVERYAQITGLPPVRRDVLRREPTGAAESVFYKAALSSRGWLDPDDIETNAIFQRMIESTISGRSRLLEAVTNADREMEALLKK